MTLVAPLVIVAAVVCVDLWVLADARRWARQGRGRATIVTARCQFACVA